MKLLFENWRKYLNEGELELDQTGDVQIRSELSEKDKEELQELIDAVIAAELAIIDTAAGVEPEVTEEGTGRARQTRDRLKQAAINARMAKKYKKEAGFPEDLDVKDMTEEQEILYQQVRASIQQNIKDQKEVSAFVENYDFLHGDILKLPGIKHIADALPGKIKNWLEQGACSETGGTVSLFCLLNLGVGAVQEQEKE